MNVKFQKNYIFLMNFQKFTFVFTILVKFDIYFLGLPWEIFFGVITKGCALAEPGGPWCLTFALAQLANLSFFIQIMCWAP